MKRINKILCAIVVLHIIACGGKNYTADDGIYFQDFDNLHCWARDDWNLTYERAHSGDYSARTDSTTEFSHTFEMEYNYAKAKGFKSMKVSGWLFVTSMTAKAGLVVSVESATGSPASESADIKSFITESNHWEKVTVFLTLPPAAPEGARIKVYLWSPNRAKIFLDDVLIKFSK